MLNKKLEQILHLLLNQFYHHLLMCQKVWGCFDLGPSLPPTTIIANKPLPSGLGRSPFEIHAQVANEWMLSLETRLLTDWHACEGPSGTIGQMFALRSLVCMSPAPPVLEGSGHWQQPSVPMGLHCSRNWAWRILLGWSMHYAQPFPPLQQAGEGPGGKNHS